MMEETYRKSKGNAGLDGVQFQLNLSIVFLLNALHSRKNWKISAENKEAAKYDDLVLELPDESILLQAKFKQNKKINRDQLFSCNSKNDGFSLPKYFFSYMEVKSASVEKTVIICTNTDIDESGLENFITRHLVGNDSMLYYEGTTCPLFTVNDNILPDLKVNAENYLDKNLQGKGFDKAVITDENIKVFLKNLQFVSNYPSGDKLDEVIGQLLSRLKSSSLYQKVSCHEVYKKIEGWFKQPKGEYLTESRAKAMFSEIKTDKYCEDLKSYGISFRHNDLNFTGPKRIFLITFEEGYLLQVLKIYDALQKEERNTLYVSPDDEVEVQKQALDAFRGPRYNFLIIIIATKVTEEIVIKEIISKLKDLLKKYSYKKIVLVAERSDCKLMQQIGLHEILYLDGSVALEDLSDECQMRLAKEKNIVFQGERISLETLLRTETMEDWARAVNSEILEKLIRKDIIKVGVLSSTLDESKLKYYVHRTFKRPIYKNKIGQGGNKLQEESLLPTVTTLNESYTNRNEEEIIPEETIYEVKEDVVLIADSAGMGKSTILTKLAMTIKKTNPHLWVIRIELTEYTDVLRNFIKNGEASVSVIELLNSKKATALTNHLERFVFSMNKKVVLMLDGIDEISPDYTELVLGLLAQCQQSANFGKLFVTTRPHMIQELEHVLKIQPFTLQSFTDQNQVDFLINYWGHRFGTDGDKTVNCEQYAKVLISRMSLWTKPYRYYEGNDFTSIPLQLRMLAEIFEENIKHNNSSDWEGCKEYLNGTRLVPKLPDKIEITKLYDMFIEKKKDIYIEKENPCGKSSANRALSKQFDESLTYHRRLALEEILHTNECQLFSCYRADCDDTDESPQKIGIVQKSNGKPHFIHRTFAEYFVAQSLITELQLQLRNANVIFQQFFIEQVLMSLNYSIIRAFLDCFLQKIVISLPSNIFERYKSCNFFKSKYRYHLIHMLANEGCLSILQFILKCVNFKIIRGKEMNIAILQNRYLRIKRNSFLSLAQKIGIKLKRDRRNILNGLEILVRQGGINIKNEFGWTPLCKAARSGHFEMVRFLVEQGANINSADNNGHTALHSAAAIGQADIVKYLVELGAGVSVRNNEGRTPLHLAVARKHLAIVEHLLKFKEGVNIGDNKGRTPLYFAVETGDLDTVKLLLELGADLNFKDNEGCTALHFAVAQRQYVIIEYLVEVGGDVNIRNNNGRTVFHFAAADGNLDLIELLYRLGADVSITDQDGCIASLLAS